MGSKHKKNISEQAETIQTGFAPGFYVLVFLLAMAARVLYILTAQKLPLFNNLFIDSEYYALIAKRIHDGLGPGGHPFLRSPFYPYFLSIFTSDHGLNMAWVRWVQALLGGFGACLLVSVAHSLFNRNTARITGILAAVYPPLVYTDGLVLVDSLQVFAFIAIFSLLVFEEKISAGGETVFKRSFAGRIFSGRSGLFFCWIMEGALFGMLAGLRASNLAAAAAVLLVILARAFRKRAGHAAGRTGMMHAVVLSLGLALTVLPCTIHNYRTSREFILLSANGGMNFWIGNHKGATGLFQNPPGHDPVSDPAGVAMARSKSGKNLTYNQASAWWQKSALDDIRSDTAGFFGLFFRKLVYAFHPLEFSCMGLNFEWFKARCWPLRLPLDARIFFILLFASLFFLFGKNKKERPGHAAFLWTILICHFGTLVLFFIDARFRMPMMPFVIMLGSVAIAGIWESMRAKGPGKFKGLFAPLAVIAALGIVSHRLYEGRAAPFSVVSSGRAEFRHLGMSHERDGKYAEAVDAYRRSLAEWDDAGTRGNLANALKKTGKVDEARAEYERSLQMDPKNSVTWYNYGNMLNFSLNQPARAKTAYAKAIECNPLLVQAYFNTGNACLKLKEYDEALRAFEQYIGSPQTDSSLAREAREIVRKIRAERVKGK